MGESFDLDPVEGIGVGAIGEPGQRRFYLRASSATQTVLLECEKYHVQGLLLRIQALLEAQGFGVEGGPTLPVRPPAEPGEMSWRVGELGLGFHEAKARFVIVAREIEAPEGTPDAGIARFWASPEQLRAFTGQAQGVLAGGRPPCPRCGLPIDPSGHPCPAANGLRPVF